MNVETCLPTLQAAADHHAGRIARNPSRVLRLGGSIAWPAKPGRVLERTEFHLFNDGRPKVYVDGH